MKLYIYFQPPGANQATKVAEGTGDFDANNPFAVQITSGRVKTNNHYSFRQGNGNILGVTQCSGVTLNALGNVTNATFG